jgi:hypothetical protein
VRRLVVDYHSEPYFLIRTGLMATGGISSADQIDDYALMRPEAPERSPEYRSTIYGRFLRVAA